MLICTVKDWHKLQHYKDRAPPWIKLHRDLLDDYDFHRLPVASRAIAPMIWLLAADSKDASIAIDYERIAFRLRQTPKEVESAIKPLIEFGFLIVASGALSDCKRVAIPETEREGEKERETEKKARKRASLLPDDFTISDNIRAWAAEKGYDRLQDRFDHFVGWARAGGKTYVDWEQAFQNAIRGNWAKIPEGGAGPRSGFNGYHPPRMPDPPERNRPEDWQ